MPFNKKYSTFHIKHHLFKYPLKWSNSISKRSFLPLKRSFCYKTDYLHNYLYYSLHIKTQKHQHYFNVFIPSLYTISANNDLFKPWMTFLWPFQFPIIGVYSRLFDNTSLSDKIDHFRLNLLFRSLSAVFIYISTWYIINGLDKLRLKRSKGHYYYFLLYYTIYL